MRRFSLLIAAAALCAAVSVQAAGPWGVEVKGRYGAPRAAASGVELFNASYGADVSVTRILNKSWTAIAGYSYLKMDATNAFRLDYAIRYERPGTQGWRQQALYALARYNFQDNVLHPFFAAGLGVGKIHHVDGEGGFDGWGTDWIARFGLSYHLGEKLRIIGEGSYDVLQGQDTNVSTFSGMLGAGYLF